MEELIPARPGAPLPPHHDPAGGFRNPWPTASLPGGREVLRWYRDRMTQDLPPDPEPTVIPRAPSDPARPRASASELRATWIGHSTWLIQMGGANILTDPQFSSRASPIRWAGPRRFLPPSLALDELPGIDAVVLSHDHYDHLDTASVKGLHARFGDALRWFVPLGYRRWFARRGVENLVELDWWESGALKAGGAELRIDCLPAQHWTSRSPLSRLGRLWCSWGLSAAGRGVYFGGDSGWFPDYRSIGERLGRIDLAILPIGAYEPRWFMRSSHMNPEDAVRAYQEMNAGGVFAGMHWGTFRLTDEDPLEPPLRARAAWRDAGLPEDRFWDAAVGETRVIPATAGGPGMRSGPE